MSTHDTVNDDDQQLATYIYAGMITIGLIVILLVLLKYVCCRYLDTQPPPSIQSGV